jgi:hypothetical protein
MKKLTFLSLVGITSIALAHASWAAGQEGGAGVFGSPGGFGGGHEGGGGGVDREAERVAAEVEWALADPALVVGPLTTTAEACITRTRARDWCVLWCSDRPP